VITLTGGEYTLTKEIVVTRSVTITGVPGSLPYINALNAIRAFRVTVRTHLLWPSLENGFMWLRACGCM
jgi:hypothetical protein